MNALLCCSSSEMKKYEDLLLDLATQCLKRRINLIPFLEEDETSTFKPQAKIWTKLALARPQLNLLAFQKFTQDNFFLSVFKQELKGISFHNCEIDLD